MKEVLSVVRSARRRIYANLFISHLFLALLIVIFIFVLVALAAKLIFLPRAMDCMAYAALAGAALAAAYGLFAARTGIFAAAVEADRELGLAERLSSALDVTGDTSPVAQAVVEDARRVAARVRPAERFPVKLPARSWRAAAALAVLAGVLSMPQFDFFGREAAFKRREKDKQEAVTEVKRLQKETAALRKILENDPKALEILKDLEMRLGDLERNPLSRRSALAKVSAPMGKLADRMKEIAKSAAKDAMSKGAMALKDEAARTPAEALAELAKMKEALAKSDLSPEAKAQIAKALDKLADQQKAREAAKSELAQMQKALEKANLTAEQQKQLADAISKMAEKLAKSEGANSAAAQQMAKAAQAMQSGNMDQALQSMQAANANMNSPVPGLNSFLAAMKNSPALAKGGQQGALQAAQQLAAMAAALGSMNASSMTPEQMAAMMQSAAQAGQMGTAAQLQAMAAALQGMSGSSGGLSEGASMSTDEALAQLQSAAAMMGRMGASAGSGPGMRGPGHGRGGEWSVGPDGQSKTRGSTVSGVVQPGRIVASGLVEGGNIKNESTVELAATILESKQQANEALNDQKVPRAYEKVVRDYFDSLDVPK